MSLPKTNVEVALAEKEIVTIVGKQSDFQETKNTAHIGDHIVTAPATGERYVLTSANFHTKYEQDPEDRDSYRSTNVVRVVRLGDDTEIKAPWGSPQYAKKGGYAAQSVTDEHDIYLIEENAFAGTYRPLPMAKPYGHDRDQGVVDPANKHFGGLTGAGRYNLDSAYPRAKLAAKPTAAGPSPPRLNEAERLAMENEKEFFRKQGDPAPKRAKR